MYVDKAGTLKLAHDLGGKSLVDLIITQTHSCYLGDRQQKHKWGFGCASCPACLVRKDGYEKYSSKEKETATK